MIATTRKIKAHRSMMICSSKIDNYSARSRSKWLLPVFLLLKGIAKGRPTLFIIPLLVWLRDLTPHGRIPDREPVAFYCRTAILRSAWGGSRCERVSTNDMIFLLAALCARHLHLKNPSRGRLLPKSRLLASESKIIWCTFVTMTASGSMPEPRTAAKRMLF